MDLKIWTPSLVRVNMLTLLNNASCMDLIYVCMHICLQHSWLNKYFNTLQRMVMSSVFLENRLNILVNWGQRACLNEMCMYLYYKT
jgi:hypothetical protein